MATSTFSYGCSSLMLTFITITTITTLKITVSFGLAILNKQISPSILDQHFCSSDLLTRYTNIVSFTHEQQFTVVKKTPKKKFRPGDNFQPEPMKPIDVNTPLNTFKTLVVQESGLISALTRGDSEPHHLMVNVNSAQNFENYLNYTLPDIADSRLVSMYLFSKINSTESDHRWMNLDGSSVNRCLYLIQVVTSSQQSVFSHKMMQRVFLWDRMTPDFTLALDPYNTGFAIHKDIFGKSDDFILYTFNYALEKNGMSLEDYTLVPPFKQLHHFEATKEEKTAAKYFYLELTNSPNEVRVTPWTYRRNYSSTSAFFSSLPVGYIEDDLLILIERTLRCAYTFDRSSLSKLDEGFAAGKTFTVKRINYALEDFLRCPDDTFPRVSKREVLRRCGRYLNEGEQQNRTDDEQPDTVINFSLLVTVVVCFFVALTVSVILFLCIVKSKSTSESITRLRPNVKKHMTVKQKKRQKEKTKRKTVSKSASKASTTRTKSTTSKLISKRRSPASQQRAKNLTPKTPTTTSTHSTTKSPITGHKSKSPSTIKRR